jgi:serine/threonine-protein kinase
MRTPEKPVAPAPAAPDPAVPEPVRQVAERFEELWRCGQRPGFEELLAGLAGDDRRLALHELAHVELELRLRAGEPAAAADYLQRYPELADAAGSLAAAQAHHRRGRRPAGPGSTIDETDPAEGGAAMAPPPGRYELAGELGRGGMGAVLRGRDPLLNRDLAVKVLAERHRENPALRRRFLEEAQVAAQLQHPGIVPVHDLGTLPDGRPFFAMKLVEGRTLADLLAERPSPAHELPRFVQVFEQVGQAVGYAHSRRVLHRDLKPANVMIGAFGEVQVMDWGLAKVLDRPSPGRQQRDVPAPVADAPGSDQTRPGTRMGTPAYMPPEQARGEPADERSDVFGLGAILCEILTGRPPYSDADPRRLLARAEQGGLGEAFARLDGCGADAELIALAESCLAPSPAERPADGGAVAAAVGAYLGGVQERLRLAELGRAAAQARAAEERKRRRWQLAGAAALLGLLLTAGGGGWWMTLDRAQRRAAEQRGHGMRASDRPKTTTSASR